MQTLNREVTWTLEDSLCYYRDLFIIVNHLDFGMFWFKRSWYDRVKFIGQISGYVTHPIWAAMVAGRPAADFADIDITKASWNDYIENM
jgi:hypothetical protein